MATIAVFATILFLWRLPALLRWLGWARPTLDELREEAATFARLAQVARMWEKPPSPNGWPLGERQSERWSRRALEVGAEWRRREVGGWRGWWVDVWVWWVGVGAWMWAGVRRGRAVERELV